MKREEKKNSKSSDQVLWRACAGRTVRVPPAGSTVFYFPQGHAENAGCSADLAASLGLPPLVPCRVATAELAADAETDEVFARISLVPLPPGAGEADGDGGDNEREEAAEAAAVVSFAKVLTQSDANNGGGFSVPRQCADTIFPPLNYAADPPVQDLFARDVHGEVWKFRHIYRGTPRRHLLTSGWSVFVNKKRLVARDSILFLRNARGEICVGIRRAKRGAEAANYGGIYARGAGGAAQEEGRARAGGAAQEEGRARAGAFAEAVRAAVSGKAFEVVYYPRDGAAEFCVKASAVRAAMGEQWCVGARVKISMEDESASRVKSCQGTVASVQAYDPIRWPNSPWRILQVAWDDETDKLRNPQRVSPWMTEVTEGVSNIPSFTFQPYSPPRKKLRLLQYPDFTLGGQFCVSPSILGNTLGPNSPLSYLPNSTPAGIQGARHFLNELSLSDFHFNNQLQSGTIFPSNFQQQNHHSSLSNGIVTGQTNGSGSSSSLLEVEDSSPKSEKSKGVKKHFTVVIGEKMVPEQLLSTASSSSDLVSPDTKVKSPADENAETEKSVSDGSGASLQASESHHGIGYCKVFKEFKDIGWTLDLSVFGSYEELYESLSSVLNIERSAIMTRVLYHDATGASKQIGNEPFSDFMKSAKRLTILAHPLRNNIV